jgi:hypothetical protein
MRRAIAYLDQSKWIELARAKKFPSEHPEVHALVQEFTDAAADGHLILPLAATNFRDAFAQASGFQNRGHGITCKGPFFCGFPRTVSLPESTEVWRKEPLENVFGLPGRYGGAEICGANSPQ